MIIEEIVKYNEEFVARRGYEQYVTSKYPDKKLAILSCMDTRLTELLPAALGLKNGDAKIIKNAGGLVISPFDSAMRSLLVAIYELGVEEIMVVAHSNCGACHMNGAEMKRLMLERGIHQDVIDTIARCGIDLDHWLEGFPTRWIELLTRFSVPLNVENIALKIVRGGEQKHPLVEIVELMYLGIRNTFAHYLLNSI